MRDLDLRSAFHEMLLDYIYLFKNADWLFLGTLFGGALLAAVILRSLRIL